MTDLMADIAMALGLVGPGGITALLPIYVRIQSATLGFPLFSERAFGVRLRVAIAFSLTILLAPALPQTTPESLPSWSYLLLREAAIGLLLVMPIRLIALSINIAATAIAATASLSQIMGTGTEASPHPIGNLLHLGGLAVLAALGLPIMFADYMRIGLDIFPVGSWPNSSQLLPDLIALANTSFQIALTLAAPFILGGLLYQALLGVISKTMPALPVVFIGAPAAILLALIGLAIIAPVLVGIWADRVFEVQLPL